MPRRRPIPTSRLWWLVRLQAQRLGRGPVLVQARHRPGRRRDGGARPRPYPAAPRPAPGGGGRGLCLARAAGEQRAPVHRHPGARPDPGDPPAIEPERLRRYAEVTAATASGEGAQALAWYAYNTCQFDAALAWFRRAVAWYPKEATVYGYALALQRAGQQRAFVDLVNRYDGLFPRVVGLLFSPRSDRPSPCDAPRRARGDGAAQRLSRPRAPRRAGLSPSRAVACPSPTPLRRRPPRSCAAAISRSR